MEKLIKDLFDIYKDVKYHDYRDNRKEKNSALNDMIGTCTTIIEKCNILKEMI